MAGNVIPAAYPLPDPNAAQGGEAIKVALPAKLLAAANYLSSLARHGFEGIWNYSDDPCQRVAAFPAMPAIGSRGAHVACWPLAKYGNRTDLEVLAFGRYDGASGFVRFRSVKTGNTVTLALAAADGWTAVGALTVDCSAGDEYVEMYLAGDTADPVHIFTASGDFPTLSGALSAPTAATDPTPFDEDELAADEPWSSDASLALLENLGVYLGWISPVMTWSGIRNTSTGGAASYSLPEWDHAIPTPLHNGQLRDTMAWTIRTLSTNVSGADEAVVLTVGAEVAGLRGGVAVPGGAGQKVASGSIQPADVDGNGQDVRLFSGLDFPLAFLGVVGNRDITTAGLNSLALWGLG